MTADEPCHNIASTFLSCKTCFADSPAKPQADLVLCVKGAPLSAEVRKSDIDALRSIGSIGDRVITTILALLQLEATQLAASGQECWRFIDPAFFWQLVYK